MGKYDEEIIEILSLDTIKSTNEVLKELEGKVKKKINWHHLYRTLSELVDKGKVVKLKSKAGFFWKRA